MTWMNQIWANPPPLPFCLSIHHFRVFLCRVYVEGMWFSNGGIVASSQAYAFATAYKFIQIAGRNTLGNTVFSAEYSCSRGNLITFYYTKLLIYPRITNNLRKVNENLLYVCIKKKQHDKFYEIPSLSFIFLYIFAKLNFLQPCDCTATHKY